MEADVSPFRKFIKRITMDILGREAAEGAVNEWVTQIITGSSPSTVVSCLLHSQERRERIIADYYRRFLQREPNAEGLGFWTGMLSAGRTHEEILTAMLSSAEYFARNGSNHDGFVRALFRDVFLRKPNHMEVDSWVGLLNSHSATRTAVANDFVTSEEFRLALVQEWFRKFLGRNPDPQGIQESLSRMAVGFSPEQIQVEILAGQEYFTRCLA